MSTLSILLLYIAASIFLGVPLSGLLTVIGLVFVFVALRTRKRALGITALVIVGIVAAVLVWAGLELIALYFGAMIATGALARCARGWLYLVSGMLLLMCGQSTLFLGLNEGLVPPLIMEALPNINLHLPVVVMAVVVLVGGIIFFGTGVWKALLRLDVLAVPLLFAAGAHVAAAYFGFMAMGVSSLESTPDGETLSTYLMMFELIGTRGSDLIKGALVPVVLVVIALVRLARQPRTAYIDPYRQPMPVGFGVLTGIALAVPGVLILILGLADANSGAQLLSLVIDPLAFVLWLVAVVVWWRDTSPTRSNRAPGRALTDTYLAVTLLLASAPGVLAAFDLALALLTVG